MMPHEIIQRLEEEIAALKAPRAVVMFKRDDGEYVELFRNEGDAINRYEQVEAEDVTLYMATRDGDHIR